MCIFISYIYIYIYKLSIKSVTKVEKDCSIYMVAVLAFQSVVVDAAVDASCQPLNTEYCEELISVASELSDEDPLQLGNCISTDDEFVMRH